MWEASSESPTAVQRGNAQENIGAALTGGNFWQGAATGFVVSALNHALHNKAPRRDYKRYFRQSHEWVGAQYGGGQDFSLSKTALGTGGMLYGVGEHIITPGNQWLGLNDKYDNTSWGGNQWTGGRSRAFKVSGYYKLAGRATFIGGFGFSFYEGVNHMNNVNYLGASKSGLDIGMGVLATYGGIPGLIIGGIYFAVDATIGWDNAVNNMENITTKTRAVHGSGWNPYKTHGWQP